MFREFKYCMNIRGRYANKISYENKKMKISFIAQDEREKLNAEKEVNIGIVDMKCLLIK